MRTDRLVTMLAADALPVPRRAASRRLGLALVAALPFSFAWLAVEFGVRRDLLQALFWPMFWVKLLFPMGIAVFAFVIAQRLARPGVRVGGAWLGLALPLLAIWLLAIAAWVSAPPERHEAMLMGQTWRSCVFNIASIALPIFVAMLAALKTLAPTKPAWAGAAAGLGAGGAGAAVYALHCPELAAPFIAVWYVAGMTLPAAAGALVGARWLRW